MRNSVRLCRFCGGAYASVKELTSHERLCDHNPEIRSCPSCAFYDARMYRGKRYCFEYPICLANDDIARGAHVFCLKYINSKYRSDMDIMKTVREVYDEALGLERALKHIDKRSLIRYGRDDDEQYPI